MLEVYDSMGMDIHLLMCDVEQLTGVVPPMLGRTKTMTHDIQLAVLLGRWECTTAEDSILMP
jgi:hypothetical protein